MQIETILNKLKTNKVKTLVLAGLMGLTPSCCNVEDNAPDEPTTKPNTDANQTDGISTNPVDSFMQHMSCTGNIKLRTSGEDELFFKLITNGNNVIGMTMVDDPLHTSDAITYPIDFDRTNYTLSDSATFFAKPYWNYWVDLDGLSSDACWEICGITDEVYSAKYEGISDEALADIAKNYLTANNSNPGYIANVYDAVSKGKGEWSRYPGKKWLSGLSAKSYGYKIGLQCSDVVRIVFADNDNKDFFDAVFSAMDDSKSIDKNLISSATTFKGSVYGTVNKQEHDDTYAQRFVFADSATFTIDAAKNETIVMPFKNWYKVTMIKSGDDIKTYLSDLPANASDWGLTYTNVTSIDQSGEKNQVNGLKVSYSYTSMGAETNFVNIKEPSIASVGELTAQTLLISNGVYSSLSTNYYKGTAHVSTGLENVYAVPSYTYNNDNEVTEVIVQGTRHDFQNTQVIEEWYADGTGDEYNTGPNDNASSSTGMFFSFVFGGTNHQR